jgi:hypothetical protein
MHEVAFSCREVEAVCHNGHAPCSFQSKPKRVVKTDLLKDRLYVMVAVCPSPLHSEHQVDFCMGSVVGLFQKLWTCQDLFHSPLITR